MPSTSSDSSSRLIWRKPWTCTRRLHLCLRWGNANVIIHLSKIYITHVNLFVMCSEWRSSQTGRRASGKSLQTSGETAQVRLKALNCSYCDDLTWFNVQKIFFSYCILLQQLFSPSAWNAPVSLKAPPSKKPSLLWLVSRPPSVVDWSAN